MCIRDSSERVGTTWSVQQSGDDEDGATALREALEQCVLHLYHERRAQEDRTESLLFDELLDILVEDHHHPGVDHIPTLKAPSERLWSFHKQRESRYQYSSNGDVYILRFQE